MEHTHCTCKVSGVTLTKPVKNATLDLEVDYCPLHAAAPALLTAVMAMRQQLWKYRLTFSQADHQAMSLASSAIAKAKGE